MKCGYIILTFLIALAAVTPALYASLILCFRIEPSDHVSWAFAIVGCLEIYAGTFWFFFMSELPGKMLANAKAELDVLRAGMRGER